MLDLRRTTLASCLFATVSSPPPRNRFNLENSNTSWQKKLARGVASYLFGLINSTRDLEEVMKSCCCNRSTPSRLPITRAIRGRWTLEAARGGDWRAKGDVASAMNDRQTEHVQIVTVWSAYSRCNLYNSIIRSGNRNRTSHFTDLFLIEKLAPSATVVLGQGDDEVVLIAIVPTRRVRLSDWTDCLCVLTLRRAATQWSLRKAESAANNERFTLLLYM